MMNWTELKETYFEAWTADGVTANHADTAAVRAWLTDTGLWTETDRRILDTMSKDDIDRLSAGIVYRVREELGSTLPEEMERAKAYHDTMQYLYDLANETNNDNIFEAYHQMALVEGDLFSPAVYYDPAVVRPEDDPADLEPWVNRMEQWTDSDGTKVVAYTDHHFLLLDECDFLSCVSDGEFMPDAMMWSFGPDEIPEHLKPLYKMMTEAKEMR